MAMDCLNVYVPAPPQYIPVGKIGTENKVLIDRGVSPELVHNHTLA